MSDLEAAKSCARCGAALFLFSVLVVVAAALLTGALTDARAREQWHEETGDMLQRLAAYQGRTSYFFERLVLAQLKWWPGLRHALRDETAAQAFAQDVDRFGARAATIIAGTADQTIRRERLQQAIADQFTDREIRELLERRTINRLARIDDASEWGGIVYWVVFDVWPPPSGQTPPGLSYAGRSIRKQAARRRTQHLAEALLAERDTSRAEALLKMNHERAGSVLENEGAADMPRLALFGSGPALRVDELLMIAGPALVFAQLLFVILWQRMISATPEGERRPFVFPAFASPVDPLGPPRPRGFPAYAERLVWLVFLILPSGILAAAVMTRYDFTMLHWEGMVWTRADDALTRVLDLSTSVPSQAHWPA